MTLAPIPFYFSTLASDRLAQLRFLPGAGAQPVAGVAIAGFCRFGHPLQGEAIVFRDAQAAFVERAEMVFPADVTRGGRLFVELRRALVIPRHSFSFLEHETHIVGGGR